MKINISFTIEYNNPKTKKDYHELINTIKNYYENNMSIPCTKNVHWKSIGEIDMCLKLERRC